MFDLEQTKIWMRLDLASSVQCNHRRDGMIVVAPKSQIRGLADYTGHQKGFFAPKKVPWLRHWPSNSRYLDEIWTKHQGA